ncbi:MAG: BatD family protein [Brevinema sp.]
MKKYLLFFFSITMINFIHAAEPGIVMEINPSVIASNEVAFIEITSEEQLLAPPVASSSPSYRIEFLSQGTASQMSIINGSVTAKRFYTYTYRLIPLAEGTFTVPGFAVRTRNKEGFGPSAKITVQARLANRSSGRSRRQGFFDPFSAFDMLPQQAFLNWRLSPDSTMQNMPVIADLYFIPDTPRFLDQFRPEMLELIRRPTLNGGVLYEVPPPTDERAFYNYYGDTLEGLLIRRYVIYPLSETTSIAPPVFRLNTAFPIYVQGNAPIQLSIRSNEGGLGYIGRRLEMKVQLSTNKVEVGDDTTLTLTLVGDGNVDYFSDPFASQNIEGLYFSQPQLDVKVAVLENNKVEMTKTFTYRISPRVSGNYTLREVQFSYRTPEGESRKVTSKSISLEGTGGTAADSQHQATFQPLDVPNGDYPYYFGLISLLICWLLGIGFLIFAIIYAKKQHLLQTDTLFARRTYSKSVLDTRLSSTMQALSESRYRDAARSLLQSLTRYGADIYSLPPSASFKDVAQVLPQHLSQPYQNLCSNLNSAAFGEEPSREFLNNCLEQADKLLSQMKK